MMGEYGCSSNNSSNNNSNNFVPRPGLTNKTGRYVSVPQRCELELCRMPDWQTFSIRSERFSSSSFADSESEEEASRCKTDRLGRQPLPAKVRWAGGGGNRVQARSVGAEGHGRQSGGPPGSVSTGPRPLAGSSSDEDVFVDLADQSDHGPQPGAGDRYHPRQPPLPYPYPPGLDTLTMGFVPEYDSSYDSACPFPPGTTGPYPPGFDSRYRPDWQPYPPDPQRLRHSSYNNGHSRFQRQETSQQGRECPSRNLGSRGRGSSSRGRPSQGYHSSTTPPLLASHPQRWSSGESSSGVSEGSFHRLVSGDEEFDYLNRFGSFDHQRRQICSNRINSSGSSGSSLQDMPANHWPRLGGMRTDGDVTAGHRLPARRQVSGQQQGRKTNPPPLSSNNHFPHSQRTLHGLPSADTRDQMSLVEKLHRFMVFVRGEQCMRVNDIQTIENAITGCHLDLKTTYETEDVGVYQGRHTYSGKLTLSGIFLARAVGQVKKELKHECYKLALQVLKTKTVTDILKQHDIGIDAIRQKFAACSNGETESSVGEAVVNMANAGPIAVAVETVATTEERWLDFISHLKGLSADVGNVISRTELSLSASRCGLERTYVDVQFTDPVHGKPAFQGSLTLGAVLQGQGQGSKKKEAKLRTYEVAFERLSKLSLAEILAGVPPQSVEEFKKDGSFRARVVVKEICTPEHLSKFATFIDRIKDSSVREGPITLLDLTANQMQLLITCLYKKIEDTAPDGPTLHACRLFVGDILISEGEGRYKKEAQLDAYSKAYDTLITTPLDTLVSENHRLNQQELEHPDVQDVVIKGQMKKEESNLPRLRQDNPNIEHLISEKGSRDMVIVEHQNWIHDRKRHAFCILQNSAILNIMLFKWTTDVETGFFVCKVFVQGEELGSAKASSRQQARNLAAADALFRMYETHPVLRVINNLDPAEHWITLEQLLERVTAMPEKEFADADAEMMEYVAKRQMSKSDLEDGDPVEISQEQKDEWKLERRMRVVALKVIEEFRDRNDVLEDLIFAPDLPVSVRRCLPTYVAKIGYRCLQCQKDGKLFLLIHSKEKVDKILEAMQSRGINSTSRYQLVTDRSELPCHVDIAPDIAAAGSISRQDLLAARRAVKKASQEVKEIRDAAVGDSLNAAGGDSLNAACGDSLNGSLFGAEEDVSEVEEGFVTAQSYMLDASPSSMANNVHSTPQTTPKSTPSSSPSPSRAKAGTPAEEVLRNFARVMMASGIGQTLIPMEASTPVTGGRGKSDDKLDNILVNPPPSHSFNSKVAGPMIKNILISPPKAAHGKVCITISSPMTHLSATGSSTASAFPQPNFSSPTTRESTSPNRSEYGSNCSTISANTSSGSAQQSGSLQAVRVLQQIPDRQSEPFQLAKTQGSPPSGLSSRKSSKCTPPRQKSLIHASQPTRFGRRTSSSPSDGGPSKKANTPFQNSLNNYAQFAYIPTPGATFQDSNGNCSNSVHQLGHNPAQNRHAQSEHNLLPGSNWYSSMSQYEAPTQFGAGFWALSGWTGIDRAAASTLNITPSINYGNESFMYDATNGCGAAVYVENELPVESQRGRKWNANIPPTF